MHYLAERGHLYCIAAVQYLHTLSSCWQCHAMFAACVGCVYGLHG